jgi:hypothetical protein
VVLVDEDSNQAQHRCPGDDQVHHKGVCSIVAPAAASQVPRSGRVSMSQGSA